MAIDESKEFIPVRIAVLTVSDTREASDDRSGDVLAGRVEEAGHVLADRQIVRDDRAAIAEQEAAWASSLLGLLPQIPRAVPHPDLD